MDVGQFGKVVALFDSDKLGEAESAFRKALLMCKAEGLRFCDVAGEAFGKVSADEAEQMRRDVMAAAAKVEELRGHKTQLEAEVTKLREELTEKENPEGEHVIDLPGRLRHAWRFWKFRLFVLTVAIGAGVAAGKHAAGVFAVLCVFLFGCWSAALFRKMGFAQLLLKWLVYGVVLLAGAAALDNVDVSARPPVFLLALAVALVLTLTKISKWLGGLIRERIWESELVRRIRGWFRDR
jgi:hypothetical protein